MGFLCSSTIRGFCRYHILEDFVNANCGHWGFALFMKHIPIAHNLHSPNLLKYGTYRNRRLVMYIENQYGLNPVHSFPQKRTDEEFTPDLNVYKA